MMKIRFLTTVALAIACVSPAMGQQFDYEQNLRLHPEQLYGCDYLCPADNTPLTAAPEGYEAFYVSHYGRHGARYAWQDDLYDRIYEVLSAADSAENLTVKGKEYYTKFLSLYPQIRYSNGELSRKGWEQQQKLAGLLYSRFPGVFGGKSRVDAISSPAARCIMTMSSFCLGLNDCNPDIEISENMGRTYLDGVLPQSKDNPWRMEPEKIGVKFSETWKEFIERTLDYRTILDRIFIDTDKTLAGDKQWDFLYYLNYFAHGMASLDTDLDFSDIFTFEECLALWKIDCFQFYSVLWPGHMGYMPVVNNIMARADERILSGERGADLRFGHDTSFLPLLMILGVNGYDHECENGDEIPVWCRMNDVPMGANLQFIFYRPVSGEGEIMFKLLFNGNEARLPLCTENWPYYRWSDFKARFGR